MKPIAWIAIAVLFALAVRAVWPRTVTVTEIITLPSQTDTVLVESTAIDSVERIVYRDRPPVFSTDTLTLRDTIYITGTDTIAALPLRWRLIALHAGHRLDSPTYVSGEALAFDGRLTRVQSVEQFPVTLGPVTDIRTDASGIHVNFGAWPEPPKTCGTGCVARWVLGGLAAGVIVGSVF
jgi:hypothetical protein